MSLFPCYDIERNVIHTRNWRYGILRLAYYSAKFLGGALPGSSLSKKIVILSEELRNARCILRMFDTIPVTLYTVKYGFGREEHETLLKICKIGCDIAELLYYPLEHISWAQHVGIFRKNDICLIACRTTWAASLYLGLLRSLRLITLLQRLSSGLKNRNEIQHVRQLKIMEAFIAIRCLVDLAHAVHWFPNCKMSKWASGLLGIISSLLVLHQL